MRECRPYLHTCMEIMEPLGLICLLCFPGLLFFPEAYLSGSIWLALQRAMRIENIK